MGYKAVNEILLFQWNNESKEMRFHKVMELRAIRIDQLGNDRSLHLIT